MNNRSRYLLAQVRTNNNDVLEYQYLFNSPFDDAHQAAAQGNMTQLRTLILANPAVVEQKHHSEETIPLCWALQNNQTEAISLLINYAIAPLNAPLSHYLPLNFLNAAWAEANADLTQELVNKTKLVLNAIYETHLDGLTCLQLSTLIQNFLLVAKHGNHNEFTLRTLSSQIKNCLQKLYLSSKNDGNKTLYTLAAWINLLACKKIVNYFSAIEKRLILDAVENIGDDAQNCYFAVMRAIYGLAPYYIASLMTYSNGTSTYRSDICYSLQDLPDDTAAKEELALVLFDAADYTKSAELAEALLPTHSVAQQTREELNEEMQNVANTVHHASQLALSALEMSKDIPNMQAFQLAMHLRMLKHTLDERMEEPADNDSSEFEDIKDLFEDTLKLKDGLVIKNNDLGNFCEQVSDTYVLNCLDRFEFSYEAEDLTELYEFAHDFQLEEKSLMSSSVKLTLVKTLLALSSNHDVENYLNHTDVQSSFSRALINCSLTDIPIKLINEIMSKAIQNIAKRPDKAQEIKVFMKLADIIKQAMGNQAMAFMAKHFTSLQQELVSMSSVPEMQVAQFNMLSHRYIHTSNVPVLSAPSAAGLYTRRRARNEQKSENNEEKSASTRNVRGRLA